MSRYSMEEGGPRKYFFFEKAKVLAIICFLAKNGRFWKKDFWSHAYVGTGTTPHPVTVTTRIIPFLVGGNPNDIWIFIEHHFMSCPFHLDRLIRSGEPNDDDIKPTTLVSSSLVVENTGKLFCVFVKTWLHTLQANQGGLYIHYLYYYISFLYIHDCQFIYIYTFDLSINWIIFVFIHFVHITFLVRYQLFMFF